MWKPRDTCTEEDRRERRRKLGLPEELTEEEKEAERKKAADKAAAEAARKLPAKPIGGASWVEKNRVMSGACF